jgi:hypothetical protein
MSGGGDEAENYGASSHGLRTVASDAHVMRDAVRAAAQQAAGVAARSRADAANLGIPCGRRCCCLIPVCVQRRVPTAVLHRELYWTPLAGECQIPDKARARLNLGAPFPQSARTNETSCEAIRQRKHRDKGSADIAVSR